MDRRAPSVRLAGLILLLFGLATLAFAVITAINIAGTEWSGPPTVVILGVMALYGGLEVAGAIGILARREWGRDLGLLTATLGTFALLAFAVASPVPGTILGMHPLVAPLAIAAAYGFVLLSLVRGERAFRRPGSEQLAR